jgi:hypothetical protein
MRNLTALLFAVVIPCGLLGEAHAQACLPGCGLQAKACIQTARTTALACKTDCRANASPEDLEGCLGTCWSGFRSDKRDCRAGIAECATGCLALGTNGDDPCLGACGQGLATCAGGVIAEGRTCVTDCKSSVDPLSCFGGCVSEATASAQACASEFGVCLNDCGVTPPTTLPPASSCWTSQAPACGGTCALPDSTCMDVLGHCACVPHIP